MLATSNNIEIQSAFPVLLNLLHVFPVRFANIHYKLLGQKGNLYTTFFLLVNFRMNLYRSFQGFFFNLIV